MTEATTTTIPIVLPNRGIVDLVLIPAETTTTTIVESPPVLPHTGPPELFGLGLGLILAGTALLQLTRKRHDAVVS